MTNRGDLMFYRIECFDGQGPFSKGRFFLDYDLTSWMDRYIKPMRYHEKHPDVKTRSWFTEFGYQKYRKEIDAMLEAYPDTLRIVHTDDVKCVAKGKVQVLEKIG